MYMSWPKFFNINDRTQRLWHLCIGMVIKLPKYLSPALSYCSWSNLGITDKTYHVHQNHTDPHDQTSQTRSQCQVSQPFPGYWLQLHHSNIWMLFLSLSFKHSFTINLTGKCCLKEENKSYPSLSLIQTNLLRKHQSTKKAVRRNISQWCCLANQLHYRKQLSMHMYMGW